MIYVDWCRQHGAVKTGYDYRCPICGCGTFKAKKTEENHDGA